MLAGMPRGVDRHVVIVVGVDLESACGVLEILQTLEWMRRFAMPVVSVGVPILRAGMYTNHSLQLYTGGLSCLS